MIKGKMLLIASMVTMVAVGLILLTNMDKGGIVEGTFASKELEEKEEDEKVGTGKEVLRDAKDAKGAEEVDALKLPLMHVARTEKEGEEKGEIEKNDSEREEAAGERIPKEPPKQDQNQKQKEQAKQEEKSKPKPQEKPEKQETENGKEAQKAEKPKPPSQNPAHELTDVEWEVVRLTNGEREKHGLPKLQVDRSLSYVARKKSEDMVKNQYFSHDSPVYGSIFQMLDRFDIYYTYAGENLAYGFSTPERVMAAWMESDGHRKNILNGTYTHIGVGYVPNGHYWTMHLIRK